jgi:transcriptional regulator with XRE-family HTH domain
MDSQALIAWRKGLGFNQAQAADLLGVSRRALIQYENGDRPVPHGMPIITAAIGAAMAEKPLLKWTVKKHASHYRATSRHGSVTFSILLSDTVSPSVCIPGENTGGHSVNQLAWDAFRAVLQHHHGE